MDETSRHDDCPTCYGDAAAWGNTPACEKCPYLGSCKWYAENPDPYPDGERGKKEHFVSYEAYAFSSEIADIVFPTPVGMNRGYWCTNDTTLCFPHARGDEPFPI